MGHPKMQTRKYARPLRPYSKDRLIEEKKLMEKFGLRRKKELWRAQEAVRDVRRRAMQLLASENPALKKEMIDRLHRLGVIEKDAEIDAILGLGVEKILGRRLQSIVHSKGLANTVKHARQMIVHKLIEINGRKVQQPSFMVSRDLEDKIKIIKKEKTNKPKTEDKPDLEKKEEKPKEQSSKDNKTENVPSQPKVAKETKEMKKNE